MGDTCSTIYVGPKRKKYLVHKALLVRSSPFFEKALQGQFQEGLANAVYLPEDEPKGFEIYVHTIYTGEIPGSVKIGTTAKEETSSYEALIGYYLLANKLLLSKHRLVEALDTFFAVRLQAYSYDFSMLFPSNIIATTLRRTARDDPLRTILLDFATISFADPRAREESLRDDLAWLQTWTSELDEGDLGPQLCDMLLNVKHRWRHVAARRNLQGLRSEGTVAKTPRYQTGFLKPTQDPAQAK